MNQKFYEIVKLTRGRTIQLNAEGIFVDLDGTSEADLVCNDPSFNIAANPETFFWVSGGGSIVLNRRWLVLIQRSQVSQINPGVFSLFTGRADNAYERANPRSLVRELFEELLLLSDGKRLLLKNPDHQSVIDAAQGASAPIDDSVQELLLTEINLPTTPLWLTSKGQRVEHKLPWHVSTRNDINVLSLFAADWDIGRLSAEDGERESAAAELRKPPRPIFLYDMKTGKAILVSGVERTPVFIGSETMSEHLRFVVATMSDAGLV